MPSAGLVRQYGSNLLQGQLRFLLQLGLRDWGFLSVTVELLGQPIGGVSNSGSSTAELFDGLSHISRFRFRSRKALMKTTLVLGMFPSFMGMTAVYILMTQFNFINNHWGLILIYTAGAPLGYMVQKGFFDSIPSSIDEAARLDGATNFQVFRKIHMPLSMPIIVYTALTSFTWPWSDYILPKLLLKTKDKWTVAVGLMSLGETEFSRFAAGSIFIAVPIVILYLFLAKYLINGMVSGAVKE